MFCALLGQVTGERLQDHLSSGFILYFLIILKIMQANNTNPNQTPRFVPLRSGLALFACVPSTKQ